MEWQAIQQAMREREIDAWLLYDFRGSNPVFWQVAGERRQTTRRVFLCIPREGEPKALGSSVEPAALAGLGFPIEHYASRQELVAELAAFVKGMNRVAMEYYPGGELPGLSWVDGGTLDLVRSLGVEVVSSADLCQVALATWSEDAVAAHEDACAQVAEVKDGAFEHIRECLRGAIPLTEFEVQQWIAAALTERGLEIDHPPIVAVNGHSGDPHYAPQEGSCARIGKGDWLLIDLWARHSGEAHPFADMTWVAYAGQQVPEGHARVFTAVKEARDRVVERVQAAWKMSEPVRGWELDRIARDHIEAAGYGAQFVHRTGHSLGPGPTIHALGANLDDYETHDEREILPGTGFSVEPGIYLPEFGVRLEIDVYVDPIAGPRVTTPVQNEPILLA
jgi:Xaa-Pro dipeptidase